LATGLSRQLIRFIRIQMATERFDDDAVAPYPMTPGILIEPTPQISRKANAGGDRSCR